MKDWLFISQFLKNSASKVLKKKNLFLIFLLFIIFSGLFGEGVLSHPRKVFVIQVDHFDILFPKESAETAQFLAENADILYEKAKSKIGAKYDLRIPIVISPDSDILSVSYTASPYNRFLVMDGVPEVNQINSGDNLLTLFYRELCSAFSSSIRSPFNQFLATSFVGSSYKPVALLNLPFSFIEGRAVLEQKDSADLKLLIQAKAENNFPSYYQACVTYDIYPGNELIVAACSAFSAYLIQAYGYEKYSELWNECGSIHPFLMEGIFYKIYGKLLFNLWNDFKQSVPFPEDYEKIQSHNDAIQSFFETDTEGLYSNVLVTDYGVVWYDAMRHEVDIFDKNSNLQIRQLLFLADDVDTLTLSPDGRYIVVSYTQVRTDEVFKKKVAWIYDLKERKFLRDYEYCLRDGAIIQKNGINHIVGVSVQDKRAKLQIWDMPDDPEDTVLVYEKAYGFNEIPYSIFQVEEKSICYILTKNNDYFICRLNFETNEEQRWELAYGLNSDDKNKLKITGMKLSYIANEGRKKPICVFEYETEGKNDYTRFGYFDLNADGTLNRVYIQNEDLFGGVHYPTVSGENVYFVSKYLSYNKLQYISYSELNYAEANIIPVKEVVDSIEDSDILFDGITLNGKELTRYLPFKYLLPVSMLPFFPIRDVTVDDGAFKWPGLGITISTHSDPFMNNKFSISAGWNFLNLAITKAFNVSEHFKNEELHDETLIRKDKSFAAFFENTSTPVDIKIGAILKYTLDGQYDFKTIAGTKWQIPIGMNFSYMNFLIESNYDVSTDYYDPDYIHINKSLTNWPKFEDAYALATFSTTAKYSNIHQYGRSSYEKRGLEIGARLYSLWDIYEIKLLNEKRNQVMKDLKENGEQRELTQAQVQEMYNEDLLAISQLNLGLFATVEIPRLTPLPITNGWVLSVPATITAEFLNTNGTALEAKAQALLIGKEIHDGFPFAKLYFSRVGLNVGYDIRLNYDTAEVVRPDFRRYNSLSSILNQTTPDDNWFVILNVDLTSPIGIASSKLLSTYLKLSYYPRTNGFVFSFNFMAIF